MSRSFVNDELTLFSYEILGLVGRGGAGAHDLLQMARRGRLLDWAGEEEQEGAGAAADVEHAPARFEPGPFERRLVARQLPVLA